MTIERRAKVEALFCVAIACVAIPSLIGHVYGTNDEALFRLIAEKQLLASDLSEYLVFINILVGRFLKWIYALAPGWPWFDLLTQLTVAVSAGVLFWTARQLPGRLPRNALTLALMPSAIVAAASPHFTQTAAIAAAAGLTLIFRVLLVPHDRSWLLSIASGIVLFVVGGLYRDVSAQLFLLLSVPALLLAVSTSLSWSRLTAACLSLLVAVGLQLAAQRYDAAAYANHPEWASFRLHNTSRNQVVDFGKFLHVVCRAGLDKKVTTAGWSPNDFKMLRNFSFSNPKIFSAERTRALAENLQPCTRRSLKHVRAYLRWRTKNVPYGMLPMLLVLSLGVAVNLNRGMLIGTSAYALFGTLVWLGMEAMFKPLPETVTFSFGLSACCFALVAVRRFPADIASPIKRSTVALSAGLLAGVMAFVVASEHPKRQPLPRASRAVVDQALSTRFDQVVPFMTYSYIERLVRPFAPIDPGLDRIRMSGWLDQTPFQQRDPLLRTGGDLFLEACRSPHQALLLDKGQMSLVRAYIKEHYGEDVVFEEVIASGGKGVRLATCRLTRPGDDVSSGDLPK